MSQEIIDAVRDIEREKGIEGGTLVNALEDALLAAYKKMPGAARHATVEIDAQGDFRVFSIELPGRATPRHRPAGRSPGARSAIGRSAYSLLHSVHHFHRFGEMGLRAHFL